MQKLITLWLIILDFSLLANPGGENIVSGKVSLKTDDKNLIINASDRSIIDWQSFSIDQAEVTKFILPSEDASCLNRVVGNLNSEILGKLESNGEIFLINPNGIVVGNGAIVDCNTFVASTLNISNEDFKNDNLHFVGNSQNSIINNGQIRSYDGDICLLAREVKNNGELVADCILIAAGEDIILFPPPHNGSLNLSDYPIAIRVKCKDAHLENKGTIKTSSLLLDASTDNPEALAINLEGTINVEDVSDSSLMAYSGQGKTTIDAKINIPDGYFFAYGRTINVKKDTIINVSSDNKAGLVSIGCTNDAAKKFNIIPTESLTVEKGAQIIANSNLHGSGGMIMLMSHNLLQAFGMLFAQGGEHCGNGGQVFIISDSQTPNYCPCNIDLSASHGEDGKCIILP